MKYILLIISLLHFVSAFSQRSRKEKTVYIDSLAYYNHKADSLYEAGSYSNAYQLAKKSAMYLANGKAFYIMALVDLKENDTSGYCRNMIWSNRCSMYKVKEKPAFEYMQIDSFYADSNYVRLPGSTGFRVVYLKKCTYVNYVEKSSRRIEKDWINVEYAGFGDSLVYNAGFIKLQPEPKGGMTAFYEKLKHGIQYPAYCKENGIEQRIWLEFTVSKNGDAINFLPRREGHPLLYREAIRFLSTTKWTPGQLDGSSVYSTFILPVSFKLN